MTKFLFVGKDDNFEDTELRIYQAESVSEIETMLEKDFHGVETDEELEELYENNEDAQSDWERFTEDHPYIIKPLDSIDMITTQSLKEILESAKKKDTDNLNKVLSAGIKTENGGGVLITFDTQKVVYAGLYVDIEHESRKHHFKISSVETNNGKFSVTAKEVGYWARRFDQMKEVNMLSVIGLDVVPVTNMEDLKKIQEATCWC